MAGRSIGAHQTQVSVGASQGSQITTQAVSATASVSTSFAVANNATGAVSATASASYGFLPEFDEFVTSGTWSSQVSFSAGDQFIVELTGSNAATNPRCRVSIQLEDT
jgi:hypothetical protein